MITAEQARNLAKSNVDLAESYVIKNIIPNILSDLENMIKDQVKKGSSNLEAVFFPKDCNYNHIFILKRHLANKFHSLGYYFKVSDMSSFAYTPCIMVEISWKRKVNE